MNRLPIPLGIVILTLFGATTTLPAAKDVAAKAVGLAPGTATELAATPEGRALLSAWADANHALTPEVKSAYLRYIKAKVAGELAAAGKTLPADFLQWIESDPVVEATVYGARRDPTGVLLLLRSLELDLGREVVRKEYTQLALAMAIVHAKDGANADLSPREPLKLVIPGDPRVPVDTKDPNRTLDVNDHIINFLKDHAPIAEDVVVGHKEVLPELKYDDRGIAIPAPKAKPKKIPVTERRARPIVAADVMASKALQDEFNAYMKDRGQSVRIDCGDGVIFPKRTAAFDRKSPESQRILDAYKMFRAAYEAKGLLPEKRDPFPTPAERCAFIIRNDRFRFPGETAKQRGWPRYPLTAPWQTLTLLAADNQPLREKEDIWQKFRDKGETRTYGEYIGPIAQQFDFQSARRLSPYPFSYDTFQMMCKDGGVCGTMANMGVRTYNTLGIPSTTAGQPGHCALISAGYDAKTGAYNFHGGQYATGGDDKTHPHTPWYFGDTDARRDMVYHQSVAYAVNAGVQSHLDSMIAHDLHRLLSPDDRRAHGRQLLQSALAINPYNFVLVDDALADAATPQEQIAFWKSFQTSLAAHAGKPGCPADGLYAKTVKSKMFERIAKLPVPPDRTEAATIYAYLKDEQCDNAGTLATYEVALNGLPALMIQTESAFSTHLASARTETDCAGIAARLKATADRIADKKQRKAWALALFNLTLGKETYFGAKNRVVTDETVPVLAKLSGTKLPAETELIRPLLDRVAAELKESVSGERELKACRALAAKIASADKSLKDADLRRRWADTLALTMAGKEEFRPANARKNAKPLRDPCADAIAALKAS